MFDCSSEKLRNSRKAFCSSCNLQVTLKPGYLELLIRELLKRQGRKPYGFLSVAPFGFKAIWQSKPCLFFFSPQTVLKQLSCHVEKVSWVQHMCCLANIFEHIALKFVQLLLDFSLAFFLPLEKCTTDTATPAPLPQPALLPPQINKSRILGGRCFVSTSLN